MSTRSLYFLGVTLALLLPGCGGGESGPERYRVSGTVTFEGEPVPYGKILFTPDQTAGNTGPQGVATIRNGRFDTSDAGEGVIGGPHRLLITGMEREGSADNEEPIPALFPEYELSLDLPRENSEQEIVVPPPRK